MVRRTPEQILNDPVTSHLRTDAATLRPDWSVGDALDHMRAHPPGGRVIYFYVTEEEGKLVGVVPTRRLLLSSPDARVKEIMIRSVIAIPDTATVLDACEFFTLHRLLAFPVVDADRKLIGVIDVELYTGELAIGSDGVDAKAGYEVFELIGVHLSEAAQRDPLKSFRGRFPWLLCNITGGLLAAGLSGIFQDVLTWKDAVLALFIPVVLALSESVAIQSVTLTISRLRGKTAEQGLTRRGLTEAAAGGLLGVGAAALVAGVAAVWLRDPTVAGVLFLAIGIGVAASAVVGFAVPTVLHRVQWNPQVAAGPVTLALADMLTLTAYFGLARAVA